nr:hypothetical protein [Shewanella shenzhenensis]
SKPQHYEEALTYLNEHYYQIRPELVEKQKAELIRFLGTLGSTDEHVGIFGNFTFRNTTDQDVVQAVQEAIKSVNTNQQFMKYQYKH